VRYLLRKLSTADKNQKRNVDRLFWKLGISGAMTAQGAEGCLSPIAEPNRLNRKDAHPKLTSRSLTA
jgi:hypothetical protein